ncbi:Transcription initiation factor TFIID subunit 2 [Bienertia sinuspersici]
MRTITQMALKLSEFVPLDSVLELIKSFQDCTAVWQVRIEARRSLLDIEFYSKGIDAALLLFIKFLEEESSLRGQAKLGIHMIRLSQISAGSGSSDDVKSPTLVALLRLLESRVAFRNVFLRHHLFCILQVLSGRRPTLYVIPRDHMHQTGYAEIFSEQRNNFLAFINQMKPAEPPVESQSPFQDGLMIQEACKDVDVISNCQEQKIPVPEPLGDVDTVSNTQLHVLPAPEASGDAQEAVKDAATNINGQVHEMPTQEAFNEAVTNSNDQVHITPAQEAPKDMDTLSNSQVHIMPVQEAPKDDADTLSNSQVHIMPNQEVVREADTVSVSQERKMPVVKFKVKQTATSNKSENVEYFTHERSQAGHKETAPVASSSVSVDAPQRNATEAVSISNQITEEVNSCQDRGSHMTASIGSAKLAKEGDEFGKELLCTADSSSVPPVQQLDDRLSPNITRDSLQNSEGLKHKVDQSPSVAPEDADGVSQSTVNPESHGKEKSKKKSKEKKRKRDDPEYLEKKRLKKEKKKKEKEMAKLEKDKRLLNHDTLALPADSLGKSKEPTRKNEGFTNRSRDEISVEPTLSRSKDEFQHQETIVRSKPNEPNVPKLVLKKSDNKPAAPEGSSGHKLKIKFKTRK